MTQAMISASNLTKRYNATLALDELTLNIPQGSVFGLLGPNGSGKTTFIKLLLGFIFPDSGHITRGTLAADRVGYLPERPALAPRSRIDEFLLLAGRLSGLSGPALRPAVDRQLRQVGLSQVARGRIGSCSKGMLQRLGLAAALLAEPPLLVLDEPMEGLDPAWQKTVRDLIAGYQHRGGTVLLSTHRLNDVVEVCTHVAILHRGQLKRAGPLAGVLAPRPQVIVSTGGLTPEAAAALAALHPAALVAGDCITLAGEAIPHKAAVLRLLLDHDVEIVSLSQQRATLEEVYLEAVQA